MRSPPRGDLLTAYNGTAITYDEVGNPNGYNDRTFTWEHGRQLATQTKGGVEWEYTYDTGGLRTKRSSDSKTYEYVYSGDKLVQMTITDHTTSPETVQLMEFSYDAAGQPLTMTLDGVTYYYVLNIQGDMMGMVDGDGNLLYTMVYEGYGAGYYFSGGSAAATMLLGTNPLGYRGYVMDAGTGLYYLQSRYYDPTLGRFINSDTYMATGSGLKGNNMFAYCLNNPVNMADSDGKDAIVVVEYIWNENGLPVVGHISVYIQDADGNWYFTEYTGVFPDKSTATVEFRAANEKDLERISKMLNGEEFHRVDYLLAEGDFSKSVELAESYDGSDYDGYFLIGNSCLDYVQEILSAGHWDSSFIASIVDKRSDTVVPRNYIKQLNRATKINNFFRKVALYVLKFREAQEF